MYRIIGNNCIRFKHHQICEFGKLWRLPEGEYCKIGSFSCGYKLFKILFLTTFVSIKTLWSNLKYFGRSDLYFFWIFSYLNIFGDSWRENDASWKVDHGYQYCLKWYVWQILFRLKHSTIKFEIYVSDLSYLNFSNLEILATPGEKTMHPGRLIMCINVV